MSDVVRKSSKKSKSKSKDVEAVVVATKDDTSMDVDAEAARKKEKKEKKKRKREAEAALAASTEGGEEAAPEKKKKKRKLEEAAKDAASAPEEPKKQKKSKSKQAEPSTSSSDASPASDAEVTAFLTKNRISLDPPITPYLNFKVLPVPSSLSKPLMRFPAPTPIQSCAWPSALAGKDVVGIAETGSGKTLAFGVPALAKLIADPPKKDGVTTLVLAPTRELAMQTHDQLVDMGKQFGIGCVAVYGGAPKEGQIRMLKNMDKKKDGLTTRIIVGTPGRIQDLIDDGACELGAVNYLVLDEADRMLDAGFENAIRKIVGYCKPKEERQTMMFSATWPESIRRLAATFQRNPARVTVGSEDLTANSRVTQNLEVFDDDRDKDRRLLGHLRQILPGKDKPSEVRVLVFALYKPEASRVANTIQRAGFRVCALHGDMKQQQREAALAEFKTGKCNVMVATDVAARGLDIPGVEVVINYTFPLKVEDYVHRIGRTGRGGRSGKAITFFTGNGPYEKGLAGEYAKLLIDGGYDAEATKLSDVFPMTIKKKQHGAYGAFFRDDIQAPTDRKKIVF